MAGRRDWNRARPNKPSEQAFPVDEDTKGAWTHTPRAPVKVLTDAEKAAFLASRPDLIGGKR